MKILDEYFKWPNIKCVCVYIYIFTKWKALGLMSNQSLICITDGIYLNLGHESARCLSCWSRSRKALKHWFHSGFIHIREVQDKVQDTLSCFVGTVCHDPRLPAPNTSDEDKDYNTVAASVLQGKNTEHWNFTHGLTIYGCKRESNAFRDSWEAYHCNWPTTRTLQYQPEVLSDSWLDKSLWVPISVRYIQYYLQKKKKLPNEKLHRKTRNQ